MINKYIYKGIKDPHPQDNLVKSVMSHFIKMFGVKKVKEEKANKR